MTERERLIDLLEEEKAFSRFMTDDERREKLADYLLDNGVIAPRYKIGDKVYFVSPKRASEAEFVDCSEIDGVSAHKRHKTNELFFSYLVHFNNFGISQNVLEDDIYTTKEEAEQALKERARW